MTMGALRSRGIRITSKRLRESIHRVDAFGAVTTWRTEIIITSYIPCCKANAVITYVHCSDNNRSDTVVFTHFKGACDYFGTPSHVRADHGGENVKC